MTTDPTSEALRLAREELDRIDGTPVIIETKVWSEYEQVEVWEFGKAEPYSVNGSPSPGAHVVRIERDIIWRPSDD